MGQWLIAQCNVATYESSGNLYLFACLPERRRAMPRFRFQYRSFILAVFLLVSTSFFVVPFSFRLLSPPARQAGYQQHPASSPNNYGKVPLAFEANAGQVNSSVRFLSHADGYTLYLTATDPVLIFDKQDSGTALHIHLTGANPHPQM